MGDVKELILKINEARPLNEEESGLIEKAFGFSHIAHQGQKRKSGEPFFNHAYQTALQLAEWRLDASAVAAGLLHDVPEDTKFAIDDVKKEFGEEIAFLVDGVTKLGHLKYRGKEEAQAENLRKMILALSKDLRVVLIKLADRLHNMKTLFALPPLKQKRISLETSEIYAPLAYRLGMQNLAGQLEDLAFPYLYPDKYQWLVKNVKERYEEKEKYLEDVKKIIEPALKEKQYRADKN